MDFFERLNPQQREAVLTTEGPLLVLAGAGSGKTRVITVRIAHLIKNKGVLPHRILAVTFTNKAAGEMRQRVIDLLTGERLQSQPLICTFHSLCVRILRADIEKLGEGYTKSFTIYDTEDSHRLIKACIRDLGYDEKQIVPRVVRSAISAAKNRGEDWELFASKIQHTDEKRAAAAKVYRMYEDRLRMANAVDFDDLLIVTVRLLRKSREVREKYNDRFEYILVDEYQDTNPLQLAMIKYLTEKRRNICVVGDDAQSIYGFRQADIRNILEFEDHFQSARVILLEQNYRSTQTILDAADAIIRNNVNQKPKKLWTEKIGGEKIFYYQAPDSESEGRFVTAKIEQHLTNDPTSRIAVLYRTNAQSRIFEENLRRLRIDYNIVGGFSFYERQEIKDVIAFLKLSLNPLDDMALLRVINTPPRGIGKATIEMLVEAARSERLSLWEIIESVVRGELESGATRRARESLAAFRNVIISLREKARGAGERPVSSIVMAAIYDTGYSSSLKMENSEEAESRLENLEELVNAAVEYDDAGPNGLREFIDHSALTSDTDAIDESARVTLMTIHSSKGLEFPIVFLVGLEDGIFPHSRSLNDPKELEEERRLAYVAITRAQKNLYLTHSMRRRVFGDEIAAEPSQFLDELPLELIEDLSTVRSWLSYAKSPVRRENQSAIAALRSEKPQPKNSNPYAGKTYNSVEAINEFFRKRAAANAELTEKPEMSESAENCGRDLGPKTGAAALDRLKAFADSENSPTEKRETGAFYAGMHVRHEKYGRGLVLRREGSGENVKLTVSFPGFGQKKLIEKFANLQKA